MSIEQIRVSTPGGKSTVTVLTYGATVLSWSRDGKEQLFLSRQAKLDGSAAVRGGIPIVFPIFNKPTQPIAGSTASYPAKLRAGLDKMPKHGFTRTTVWAYLGAKDGDAAAGEKVLEFGLDTDEHKAIYEYYPYHVKLTYEVRISDASPTLTTALHVHNPSTEEALPFHALFHNYYRVTSAETAQLAGLSKAKAIDTADGYKIKTGTPDPLVLHGKSIDDVFYDAPHTLALTDGARVLTTHQSETLKTTTVWSPAAAGAAGIGDLHQDGWKEFLCVEPGSIKDLNFAEPQSTWTASQTLTVAEV